VEREGGRLLGHGDARIAGTAVERVLERVRVDGLGEVVRRTELHRFHGRRDRRVAGEHHGANGGQALDQVLEHLEPPLAPEAQVDHREARPMGGGGRQGLAMVAGADHRVAPIVELELHGFAEGVVVIDDEQPRTIAIAHGYSGHRDGHSMRRGRAAPPKVDRG
jgi:hypothetical protein